MTRPPAARPHGDRGRRLHRVLQELRRQHAHARAAGHHGGARGRRACRRRTSTASPAIGSATARRRCSSRSRSASRDLRFHLDLFGGGSVSHQVVASAAMAVATGMAETVVCWRAINARSEFRMGGTGRAAPDTIEFQYQVPYGYATPPQQFAMQARAYMHEYGVGRRGPRPGGDQPAPLRAWRARGR